MDSKHDHHWTVSTASVPLDHHLFLRLIPSSCPCLWKKSTDLIHGVGLWESKLSDQNGLRFPLNWSIHPLLNGKSLIGIELRIVRNTRKCKESYASILGGMFYSLCMLEGHSYFHRLLEMWGFAVPVLGEIFTLEQVNWIYV